MADRLPVYLFFFVLVFSPLAFGTVEPWSYAVMEISVAAAFFLFLRHTLKNDIPLCEVHGLVFLGLFLLFIALQVLPLPAGLVRALSPSAHEIQQYAAFARGGDSWMTLSVHPYQTILEFLRYSTYAAFYVFTVQLLSDRDMLRKTVFVVAVFGAALSFSSILQLYLTEDMALWVRHVPVHSMIVGPYICHNHYAGLMAMIFPVVLGLFLFYRPKIGGASVIRGIIEIFGQEKANIHILIGAGALLIATSIVLSLSRGAIISTCLALFIFTWLVSRRGVNRDGTMISAFAAILVFLSVSWFGWEPVLERFGEIKGKSGAIENTRLDYWKDSGAVIRDYPAAGAGFGTFADIYRPYQTIGENHFVDHAHNDYIELAVQGGFMGVFLAAGFMATVLFKSFRAFTRRRDPYCIYIFVGAVTGIAALLFHGTVDFNMQIGANGLWFFFLVGLSVAAANTRLHSPRTTTRLKLRVPAKRTGRIISGAAAALLVITVLFNLSVVAGHFYYANIRDFETETNLPANDAEKIRRIASYAASLDPLNAKYDYAAGNAAWVAGNDEAAEAAYLRAIAANPVKAMYYKRYGLFLTRAGQREKAARMLERSVAYDPVKPENHLEYGALLVFSGDTEKGMAAMKMAVSLDVGLIDRAVSTLALKGFTPGEMAEAIPDQPGALVRFAGFLEEMGDKKAAEETYGRALARMEEGASFRAGDIYRVYRFFLGQGRIREAMETMMQAETLLPGHAGIKITLGDLYRRQGIAHKAREMYEAALMADPGNQRARNRLSQTGGL